MSHRVRTVTTVIIAVLVVAALVAPALAHAQLLGSAPANGSSQPTADRVELTFNEDISPEFVQIVVVGPDGDVVSGDPSVEGPVVTQLVEPISSGAYVASYRVVSADGHPVSGEVRFTLTDVPEPEPSPESTTPTETTATESPSPTPTVEDTPTATPEAIALEPTDGESGGAQPLLWAALALGLGGAAALVAWRVRRRSEPTP